MRLLLLGGVSSLVVALVLVACGGNRYGYGREYTPTSDEDDYYERAADLSYEEVRRDPASYARRTLGWFGVVQSVTPKPGGEITLALNLRFHQQRHLCSDQFESSCRVTISERAGGPFSTTLRLRSEDTRGAERLNVGSLVKVYGSPTGEFDDRGGPVLKIQWYRHWPHGAYVATTGRTNMRQ